MEWFKFFTRSNREDLRDLRDPAFRLWVEGRCYIAEMESDGLIPAADVCRLGKTATKRNIAELVAAGLWWEADDGGYIDVKWLGKQKSREQMEAAREGLKKRVGNHRRNAAGNAVTNAVGTRAVEVERDLDKDPEVGVTTRGRSGLRLAAS